jgi:CobQ-like glutamine amidotransferase family enzyme
MRPNDTPRFLLMHVNCVTSNILAYTDGQNLLLLERQTTCQGFTFQIADIFLTKHLHQNLDIICVSEGHNIE